MSGKRPGTWIRIWRSFKWPSRDRSLSTTQSIAEPPTIASPLVIQADDPALDAANLAGVAAQAVAARPSIPPPLPVQAHAAGGAVAAEPRLVPPPLPVQADPSSEATDPAEAAAQALAKLSSFAPPPPVKADPAGEALEPVEVAASLQSLRQTTDFMLPARLAIIAKLNVASIRAPRHHPYRLSPGRAVPLASSAQPARVCHPQRLEAMKPMTRIIIRKRTGPAPSVIIDLDAARKAVQSSPIAKQAA